MLEEGCQLSLLKVPLTRPYLRGNLETSPHHEPSLYRALKLPHRNCTYTTILTVYCCTLLAIVIAFSNTTVARNNENSLSL